jgi:phosphatidylethanolamine/phosphatidyl-N-methylethanolamine N-methyltransferase
MDPIIVQHYQDYNDVYYTGGLGLFERWTHQSLEKGKKVNPQSSILDIGGGDGQHVPFLSGRFSNYTILDLLDHSQKLNPAINSVDLPKVNFVLGNAEKLPFEDESFDRIILTCILHHVDSPAKVLSECRRVLRNGGELSIYLPDDPGMIYRWIRHFGAHKKYSKRTKRPIRDIKYLWAIEHQNHVLGISTVIRRTFQGDSIRRRSYPLPLGSWNFNLFQVFQIVVNKDQNV